MGKLEGIDAHRDADSRAVYTLQYIYIYAHHDDDDDIHIYIYIYIYIYMCVCGIYSFFAGQNVGYAGTRCISIFPYSSAGICEDIS